MSIGISSVTTTPGSNDVVLTGTGPPGGTISVTVNGTVHTTTVGANGIWTITVSVPPGQSAEVSLNGTPSKCFTVDIEQNAPDSA